MSIHANLRKTAIALSLGLAGTSVALAAPLVTEWGYEVTTDWVTAGPNQPTFTGGGGATYVSSKVLSWGDDKDDGNSDPTAWNPAGSGSGDRRSGLVITPSGSVPGSDLETNGAAVNTHTITHYNNEIAGSFSTLLTASVFTTLTLTPLQPAETYGGAPSLGTLERTFTVNFTETTNVENCADPLAISDCDDIFVFNAEDLVQNFEFLGNFYTLSISAPGLGELGPVACGLANAGPGCIGFRTEEFASTDIVFNFNIVGREGTVPEPGVLGLLGLGLAAVGLRARRRQS